MDKQKPKILKASKSLQMKAGKGDISAEIILQAEDVILQNNEDFLSIAEEFLVRLNKAVEQARAARVEDKPGLISAMVKPVMQLKANAKMFKYNLVTTLANIMLDFLETIDKLDNTAIDIVAAHHKTLSLIVSRKISGDGGQIGVTLQKELQSACSRYFAKEKN